jgi:hypothetical protein
MYRLSAAMTAVPLFCLGSTVIVGHCAGRVLGWFVPESVGCWRLGVLSRHTQLYGVRRRALPPLSNSQRQLAAQMLLLHPLDGPRSHCEAPVLPAIASAAGITRGQPPAAASSSAAGAARGAIVIVNWLGA